MHTDVKYWGVVESMLMGRVMNPVFGNSFDADKEGETMRTCKHRMKK